MSPSVIAYNRRLILRLVVVVLVLGCVVRAVGEYAAWRDRDEARIVPARAAPAKPKRAVIISIDGCRPDVLLRARAPNLRWLMDHGSFSLWARTTEMSITLPSHTSMLTGVKPEYHRILWNDKFRGEIWPESPTLFELARKANLRTALVAGKNKFNHLARPGTVDHVDVFNEWDDTSDLDVAAAAVNMIRSHPFEILFIHFPRVDSVGHAKGWGTPEQVHAVGQADIGVGMVLDALLDRGMLDDTFIILSADHGGQGADTFGKGSHGPNDPRSRHIPWIAFGPGVRQNFDLTRYGKLIINTEDTFATTCWVMKISVPHPIDGKPIRQIFAGAGPGGEMITSAADDDPAADSEEKAKKPRDDEAERYLPWRAAPYKKDWERIPTPEHQ